ncbi:phosphatidylinositol kinase- protein kinase tor1 [Pichia californica]|uniref:non-specific serine/threonine protein kinase n=1 Tax=Pichia californica TaxID=460514 RepID=A0A9P6WJL3_9ASCO|nr:phosphatidylinositol kinase- protein kinase tor1 [[Candida] californica]
MSQSQQLNAIGLSTGTSVEMQNFTLDQIFKELKSNDEVRRIKAAKNLRLHFISISRDLTSTEQITVYNNYINKKIFDLVNSSKTNEQLGGIEAINSLIELLSRSSDDSHLTQLTSSNSLAGNSSSNSTAADENSNMITRYANYLRKLLSSNDITVMRSATATIGKLAIPGISTTADFVDFEVKRSLEWLIAEKIESKRHAAILIISSLAENSPALLYQYVKQIFNNIWIGLRDTKSSIREDSAVCLRHCLDIVYERDNDLRNYWFSKLYNEAFSVFKAAGFEIIGIDGKGPSNNNANRPSNESSHSSTGLNNGNSSIATQNNQIMNSPPEFIHGSLLCFRELVNQGTSILGSKIDEIYETIMRVKDYKSGDVRREVTSIIPKMARYDKIKFVDRYMHRVLLYYISQLKVGRDKVMILISIGDIATEAKNNIVNYLNGIVLETVRDGLSQSSIKVQREMSPACCYCLSKLVLALGPPMTKFINSYQILRLLLKSPIDDNVLCVLKIFSKHLPSLEPIINDRLISSISCCLSGYEFRHPGSPDFERLFDQDLAFNYRYDMLLKEGDFFNQNTISKLPILADIPVSKQFEDPDVTIILQALKTLRCFVFKNYDLTEFVQYAITHYISHQNPEIRLQASVTCAELFRRSTICFERSAHSLKSVDFVLGKLLTTCITDPVAEIRLEVIKSLDDKFDPHLSQAENVKLLFMTLNDEDFEIRKESYKLVGRLTFFNPAFIVPPLRKILIQLITNLEYGSHTTRIKEESNILLGILISSTDNLTKSYTKQIMNALLPQAADVSPVISASAITTIGFLADVSGDVIMPFVPQVMPILIDSFQDQNLAIKRNAALKTLGQIAGSAGYVIQPLLDYPQLLGLLVNILKSETSTIVRRDTVRLLGILGALDPYKHREVERKGHDAETVARQNAPTIDMELLMKGKSPTNDDYFPTVVIKTLIKILRDNSLTAHHLAVTQAIMNIFTGLGMKCVPFLDQVIPAFELVMHNCPISMLNTYFQQLSDLIDIVKLNIRSYLPQIFKLIQEFFPNVKLQGKIIGVIERVSKALEDEFKLYMLDLINIFLNVLEKDLSPGNMSTLRVLKSFVIFDSNLEPYIYMIIPSLIKLFEYASVTVRKAAIECVGRLSRNVPLNDYASEIIQPLLRLLSNYEGTGLRTVAMTTICSLLLQMGSDFKVFIPVVSSVLIKSKLQFPLYDQFVERLNKGRQLPSGVILYPDLETTTSETSVVDSAQKKLTVNAQTLRLVWDCSSKRTKEDWQEWMRKLTIELLKESPSQSLRACTSLASVYPQLAKDLFNCAFASCWNELHIQYQGELAQSLCIALSSVNSSPEIHQALLNLTEFLEHDEKSLPIRIQTLGQYAQRSHAYAKALHYKELEFIQEPSIPTIESLISINNQLQQSDAAIGILKYAQEHHGLQLKETWYEKLQRWDDALHAYNEREKEEPNSTEITMGKMRCLHALGEWESLSMLAREKWDNSSADIKRAIAPLAAAAAWGLRQWEKMDTYIAVMKKDSPDKAFFNAILSLHNNNFDEASLQINQARDLLATEVTALVSESYNRAYGVVVRVQMLAELEEIIKYKCLPQGSEKRVHIIDTWNKRLLGCQKNVDIWQRMLKARALVVKPKQDMEIWIKFANLCRKSGRLRLAEKSLNALLDEGSAGKPGNKASPHVVYAQLKYMWSRGQQAEALSHLVDFTSKLSRDLGLNENEAITQPLPTNIPGITENIEKFTKLLARCYLKQGEWKIAMDEGWIENEAPSILGSFLLATHYDPKWYKAWHNWALANFEVISPQSKHRQNYILNGNATADGNGEMQHHNINMNMILRYVVPAVKGFFHSIALSYSNPLQDTLRLLTLWLDFGGVEEVANALQEGLQMVKVDTWLDVIPQLISHIHQPDPIVSHSLLGLLSDLGRAHPQALVYPLTVAIKAESVSRQKAALTIIDKMRAHSSTLVDQADMVSNELIRVSVLWHEMWYEALEDASRAYFNDHDVDKMFSILDPLNELIHKGPHTIREISFTNAFGKDLSDAHGWLHQFKRTKDHGIYTVFRKISKQLPLLQNLDLQHCSPLLLHAHDLELAVPGTYETGKEIIRIMKFDPIFMVITSKQRPRKLHINGSDGKTYTFVLKAHEDIRQDSLVMQLFGLVNTLLANDPECFKRHVDIQKYAAIPLSPSSGLLGWVPNSDTFHVLIKEYRDPRKIYLDVEHRVMLQMSPDYDNLTLLEKVEVFTYALDITRGQDLYKVLWFKSKSSESWLDRRTTYTRSLAAMSMVGYILGLGDRHPSNLMMDRITGKVIHIDFGDCFEAAIMRDKYPEKVPFRLTRMLSYAMEVSGIEGSFRITSENVMKVLRENKESLMALLEAFAYDPLINWGFDFPIQRVIEQAELPIKLPEGNYVELLRNGQITEEEATTMATRYKASVRDARAACVLKRINDKLTGNDFKRFKGLDVSTQVDKLIQQATSVENLCQHYIGWCAFW